MTRQSIPNLVSVGVLGFLVLIFGVVLLVAAIPVFVPNGTFGFGFGVSRRALTLAVIALLILVAAVLFLFAQASRRRHLN